MHTEMDSDNDERGGCQKKSENFADAICVSSLAAVARLEAPQPDGGVVRAAHDRVLARSHLKSVQ